MLFTKNISNKTHIIYTFMHLFDTSSCGLIHMQGMNELIKCTACRHHDSCADRFITYK